MGFKSSPLWASHDTLPIDSLESRSGLNASFHFLFSSLASFHFLSVPFLFPPFSFESRLGAWCVTSARPDPRPALNSSRSLNLGWVSAAPPGSHVVRTASKVAHVVFHLCTRGVQRRRGLSSGGEIAPGILRRSVVPTASGEKRCVVGSHPYQARLSGWAKLVGTKARPEKRTDKRTDNWTDRWSNRWPDRWPDRSPDRWPDKCPRLKSV